MSIIDVSDLIQEIWSKDPGPEQLPEGGSYPARMSAVVICVETVDRTIADFGGTLLVPWHERYVHKPSSPLVMQETSRIGCQ